MTDTEEALQHWRTVQRGVRAVTTSALPSQTVVPVASTIKGIACAECGLCFPSTKP